MSNICDVRSYTGEDTEDFADSILKEIVVNDEEIDCRFENQRNLDPTCDLHGH